MADLGTEVTNLLQERPAPPGLPPRLLEARKFAYWGKLGFLFAALIYFVFTALTFFGSRIWFWGGYGWGYSTSVSLCYGGAMIVAVIAAFLVDKHVILTLDAGRTHEARSNALIWAIVGVFVGLFSFIALLPALLLGVAWLKMEEHGPAPTPAAPGYPVYQPPPPPAYSTPPPPGGGYLPPPAPPGGLPPPPPP